MLRLPKFLGSRHIEDGKVVSRMHRPPLPPSRSLVLIYVRGWVDPRALEPRKGLSQMKNSNDAIGSRTRHLPACGAVPEQILLFECSQSVRFRVFIMDLKLCLRYQRARNGRSLICNKTSNGVLRGAVHGLYFVFVILFFDWIFILRANQTSDSLSGAFIWLAVLYCVLDVHCFFDLREGLP
jgi:hypothetical protein